MLLGFQSRFEQFVAEGSKTHTIRAYRKRRPKVGEACHCYGGVGFVLRILEGPSEMEGTEQDL